MDGLSALSLILGAGGVAFLGALFKGVQMWRDGTDAREAKAIAGLEKWRVDADHRADRAQSWSDYYQSAASAWQSHAGTLAYALTSAGLPVPPDPVLPPRPQEPPRAPATPD